MSRSISCDPCRGLGWTPPPDLFTFASPCGSCNGVGAVSFAHIARHFRLHPADVRRVHLMEAGAIVARRVLAALFRKPRKKKARK